MKMATKFKVCTPKADADLCMRVDLPLDKKLWKIRTRPPATGPSWAVGRRAADLLLAKPVLECCNFLSSRFPSPDGKVLGQMSRGQVCWLALWVPESRLGVFFQIVDTLFYTVFSDRNERFVSLDRFFLPCSIYANDRLHILDIVLCKSKRTAIARSCEVTRQDWRLTTPEVWTDGSQFCRFYSRLTSTNMHFCDILKQSIINGMSWPYLSHSVRSLKDIWEVWRLILARSFDGWR